MDDDLVLVDGMPSMQIINSPPDYQRQGECSGQPSSLPSSVANGFPRLAAFQSNEANFSLYRSFSYLHSRVLLDLQDELQELERELDEIDWEDIDDTTGGEDDARGRGVVLREIKAKLLEYDEVLIKARQVEAFQKPSSRNYRSVRRWLHNEQPFVDKGMVQLKADREFCQHNPRFPEEARQTIEKFLGRESQSGWKGLRHDPDFEFLCDIFPLVANQELRPQDMELIPRDVYQDSRWHLKGRHNGRIPIGIAMPMCAIASATLIPCAAAMFRITNWPASAQAIAGVMSTSTGVSLVPLQIEPGNDTLRWGVRALWASTYGVFLLCSYMRIMRNSHLYLFCSLLLAAHFVAGFAGTAETPTEGILTFGPLAATLCAVLVYIPFRSRPGSASGGAIPMRPVRSTERGALMRHGRSSSAPAGVRAAVTGILGVVV